MGGAHALGKRPLVLILLAALALSSLPASHSFLHVPATTAGARALATSLACLRLPVCSSLHAPLTNSAGGGARSLNMYVKGEEPDAKEPLRPENRPTTILVVRHGETEWNTESRWQGQKDSPLTPQGEQQAKALGARLKEGGWKLDAIYSSDLLRAYRSAEYIAEAVGYPKSKMCIDKLMRERAFGIFEGKTRDEVAIEYPEELRAYQGPDPDFRIDGAESRNELLGRSLTWLERIGKEHQGETVLVMTHGAVVSSLIREMLSIPYDPKPMADLRIRNTCMCELRQEPGSARWTVLTVGDVAHTERERIHEITTTVEQESGTTNTIGRKKMSIASVRKIANVRRLAAPIVSAGVAGVVGFLLGKGSLLRLFM